MTINRVHRRCSGDIAKRREIRDLTHGQNASTAIGTLTKGCEIFGFSKGQFSLINLIIAVLDQTGPADVWVSTWTAAKAQIETAYRLLSDKSIRSLRWLVDYSFPARQPVYCARLRERFGDGAIRVTKNHAKFVLIRNDAWDIVLRTSMNLNENPRFEFFEITEDARMAEFLTLVIDDIFQEQAADETFALRPQEHCDQFAAYGIDPDAIEHHDTFGICLDDAKRPGITIE